MKRLFLLALSFVSLGAFAQESTMQFENGTVHDFGNIEIGVPTHYDFKFKNTGTEPIIISSATASCGCTVPDYPKEPIMPGKEGVIKVNFNGSGKNRFQKSVTLTTNLANPRVTLFITGTLLTKDELEKQKNAGNQNN